MADLADIFADNVRMNELVASINKIESAVIALAEKATGFSKVATEGLDKAKEGVSEISKGLKATEDQMTDLVDGSEKALTGMTRFFQTLKGAIENSGLPGFVKDFEQLSRTMMTMQSDPSSLIQRALTGMGPIGNMLEIALRAQTRVDEFQTQGRQAVMGFQSTGNTSTSDISAQGNALGKEMMHLRENWLASEADVKAVYQAMVQGGSKLEDAFKKSGVAVAGFRDNVAETSLGLDKAFQVSAGTSMQFAETLTKETGTAIEKSVQLVRDLGNASHDTGMNMQTFVGQILQVTSALRTQGSDANELAKGYFNIQSAFEKSMVGQSQQRIGDVSMTALTGLVQGVQGMSEGMQAQIAQRVGKAMTGQDMDQMHALRGFKSGFSQMNPTKGKDFASEAISALDDFFKEQTSNEDERFRLIQATTNMSAQAVEYLLAEKGKFNDPDRWKKAQADKKQQEAEVAEKAPLTTSAYTKSMESLSQVINAVGELIATLLGSAIRVLIGIGELLVHPDAAHLQGFNEMSDEIGTNIGGAFGRVSSSISKAGIKGLGFLNSAGGILHDTEDGSSALGYADKSLGRRKATAAEVAAYQKREAMGREGGNYSEREAANLAAYQAGGKSLRLGSGSQLPRNALESIDQTVRDGERVFHVSTVIKEVTRSEALPGTTPPPWRN